MKSTPVVTPIKSTIDQWDPQKRTSVVLSRFSDVYIHATPQISALKIASKHFCETDGKLPFLRWKKIGDAFLGIFFPFISSCSDSKPNPKNVKSFFQKAEFKRLSLATLRIWKNREVTSKSEKMDDSPKLIFKRKTLSTTSISDINWDSFRKDATKSNSFGGWMSLVGLKGRFFVVFLSEQWKKGPWLFRSYRD